MKNTRKRLHEQSRKIWEEYKAWFSCYKQIMKVGGLKGPRWSDKG